MSGAINPRSELFRDLLPLLNSGRIVLPRNDRLQGQIVGLERRTSAVGRDTISHPDRGHDDVANAVAGAAALSKFGGYDTSLRWVSGDDDERRRLAARPSSSLHQQRGAHPTMTEFCALSHAESARHIAQTPATARPCRPTRRRSPERILALDPRPGRCKRARGFVPYSPLGKGFLTGAMNENTKLSGNTSAASCRASRPRR